MGPMAVAMAAVAFFMFAAFSALVSAGVGFVAVRHLCGRTRRLYGAYVLGSGCLGAIAAMLFGFLMRWNAPGDAILRQPLLGYPAWAFIGFGWSALAAFAVGALVRRLLSREAKA
jgi:hypothetical protein